MPRNPDGTYALPLPPVLAGQTIEATWANQTLADLSQAMQDSLSRSAQGSMTAVFKAIDGSQSAPGIAFVNESNTGFYRPSAGDLVLSVLGQNYMRWSDDNGVQFSLDGVNWQDTLGVQEGEAYVDDREVTAIVWDSAVNQLTLTKSVGDLEVVIDEFEDLTVNGVATVGSAAGDGNLQVGGPVNQLSVAIAGTTGNLTANTASGNRFLLTNNGPITLTITKPVGARDIGTNYTIEGTILVSNGATPGVVTIAGAGAGDVLGSNPVTASTKYLLSYLIHNRGGAYTELYVWSAMP